MVSFATVPRPVPGRLWLYVFGPGFGECQIAIMPDGKCIVIDTCVQDGVNIVVHALAHFGITRIDLLIVTHGDLDHVSGLGQAFAALDIRHVWRYPGAGTLVDLLPRLLRLFPGDTRLVELSAALDALDELQEQNRVYDAGIETREWPSGSADYRIAAIAPTPKDVGRYRRELESLLVEISTTGTPELGQQLRAFLVGTKARLSPGSNPLSIAVAIRWKQCRIVLGGDVETSSDPESGWNGLNAILLEEGRQELLQNSSVVKAAHHGSRSAFCEPAWKLHAQDRKVLYTVITPFNRGVSSPPHAETLRALKRYSARVGVTSKPKASLPGHGWKALKRTESASGTGEVSCLAMSFTGNGHVSVRLSGAARLYV